MAVFHRLTETIDYLVTKGADVNSQDIDGNTPLHFAAMYTHSEMVEQLLQHGASPVILNTNGLTPLAIAIASHNDFREAMAERLLSAGSPLDLNDAVSLGREQDVEEILRRDPEAVLHSREPDRLVQDAIDVSVDTWTILEAVLRRGANPNKHRPEQEPPLIYALSSPGIPPEVVQLLLEYGADVHVKSNTGDSVLAVARNFNPSTDILDLVTKARARQ